MVFDILQTITLRNTQEMPRKINFGLRKCLVTFQNFYLCSYPQNINRLLQHLDIKNLRRTFKIAAVWNSNHVQNMRQNEICTWKL